MSFDNVVENWLVWATRDPSGYKFRRRDPGRDHYALWDLSCRYPLAQETIRRLQLSFGSGRLVQMLKTSWLDTMLESGFMSTHANTATSCKDRLENCCEKGFVPAFNAIDEDGTFTKGGFSTFIVVHQRFCFRIPDYFPLASAGPLLLAGITCYSPMTRYKMNQPGKSLGVIGLGGLDHMAVKFAKAFGLNVTVFSTSITKKDDALNLLAEYNFVISSDLEQMNALAKSYDFLIDTTSGSHPFDPCLSLLKITGIYVLVRVIEEVKFNTMNFIIDMRTITASVVGGAKEMQEMVEFCSANGNTHRLK